MLSLRGSGAGRRKGSGISRKKGNLGTMHCLQDASPALLLPQSELPPMEKPLSLLGHHDTYHFIPITDISDNNDCDLTMSGWVAAQRAVAPGYSYLGTTEHRTGSPGFFV